MSRSDMRSLIVQWCPGLGPIIVVGDVHNARDSYIPGSLPGIPSWTVGAMQRVFFFLSCSQYGIVTLITWSVRSRLAASRPGAGPEQVDRQG